ncbi:MAG: hypothetical protein ACRCUY_12805 [Thermoguttaceae bacterium]
MIIAYHVIFSAYGFWLPNDPRGRWSNIVSAWELYRFGGAAVKAETRKSVAAAPHDIERRLAAKEHLKNSPAVFTEIEVESIGRGFAIAVEAGNYAAFACAILPEHVHLVLGSGKISAEQMVGKLKQRATQQLVADGFSSSESKWAKGCWKVFLNTTDAVQRAIQYVVNNPIKEGRPVQNWSFVSPFSPVS